MNEKAISPIILVIFIQLVLAVALFAQPKIDSRQIHSSNKSIFPAQSISSINETDWTSLDTSGYTPDLTMTENGVFYASLVVNSGTFRVLKSSNNGSTWSTICTMNYPNGYIDGTPVIEAIDASNSIVVAVALKDTISAATYRTSVKVFKYDTTGANLVQNTVYTNSWLADAIYLSLTTNKFETEYPSHTGNYYLAVNEFVGNRGVNNDILVYSSTNNGNSWSAGEMAATDVRYASSGKSIAASYGTIYLCYLEYADATQVRVSQSSMNGWTNAVVLSSDNGAVRHCAIAAKSGVIIVSGTKSTPDDRICVSRSTDFGFSWSTQQTFTNLDSACWQPSVAVNRTGQFSISAYNYRVNTNIVSWSLPTTNGAWVYNGVLSSANGVNLAWLESALTNTNLTSVVWSDASSRAQFALEQPPLPPTLSTPMNNATSVAISPNFTWQASETAQSYRFQLSTSSNFGTTLINQTGITQTRYSGTSLSYSTTYYWRVCGDNHAGTGEWSTVWHFTTVGQPLPIAPLLLAPINSATNVGTSPTQFVWQQTSNASSYRITVDNDPLFQSPEINDTTRNLFYSSNLLQPNTVYYWKVRGINGGGQGPYSTIWYFTTAASGVGDESTQVTDFRLDPAYPNPFNPSTTISYSVKTASPVDLRVFTPTGVEVATLVHRQQQPGRYSVSFDGSQLPSGIYFYRMEANHFSMIRKMILVK